MKLDFPGVVREFEFEGDFVSAAPYGTGHINDTYAAVFHCRGRPRRYLLQRINHNVFKDPEGLMENIRTVTAHLKQKIIAAGGDLKRGALSLIPTREGAFYIRTEGSEYWRAYNFIEGARTYEIVEHMQHVYNAAWAFGNFQSLLSDLSASRLHETIPDFHHTGKRFESFLRAVDEDRMNLAHGCKEEIGFVLARADLAPILIDLAAQGKLPERVTHNDTKFNNVLIDDETDEVVCVIDLDTVMPGLSLYDFGDSIRSLANTAAEDERDLAQVNFSIEVFDRYTHGYLDAARGFLTATELEHLPFSAILMTLECGMRFLADHLQGDVYFKTSRNNHNLDRCRTQFRLVQEMEEQFDAMVKIVRAYRV